MRRARPGARESQVSDFRYQFLAQPEGSVWAQQRGDVLAKLRDFFFFFLEERELSSHALICCCLVTQSFMTLCHPMDCSTQGFPVLHHLPELAQTHVHWVGDAIQPSSPLSSPSSPALNLSQHQGPFQWVGSSHQVAKVLELVVQHCSFQWIFRVDFL